MMRRWLVPHVEVINAVNFGDQGMGADPAKLAVFMYVAAGLCAEERALENELRYLRASRANMIEEAQDARINQKRLRSRCCTSSTRSL